MPKSKKNSAPSGKGFLLPAGLIALFLIIIIGIVLFIYTVQFPGEASNKQETWGQFGDYFGGILNPTVGFVSIALLLYTIWLQKDELHKSTTALEAQGDSMQLQSFENTFFSMLQLSQQTLAYIQVEIGESESRFIEGKNAFKTYYDRFKEVYQRKKLSPASGEMDERQICKTSYAEFFSAQDAHFKIYISTINETIRYIDDGCPEAVDSTRYWRILSSQLSRHELLILFYEVSNGPYIGHVMDNKMNQLFNHIDTAGLIVPDSHIKFIKRA